MQTPISIRIANTGLATARARKSTVSIESVVTLRLSAILSRAVALRKRRPITLCLAAMSASDGSSRFLSRLDEQAKRFDELHALMNEPAVLANPQRIVAVSKEAGQLEPIVTKYRAYLKAQAQVDELK